MTRTEHPIHEAVHERLAHSFAMKYGLVAEPAHSYEDAVRLEKALARFLRHALSADEKRAARVLGALQTVAQYDDWAANWLERNP